MSSSSSLLAKPLGAYMARVYEGQRIGLDRVLGWLERLIYRLCRRPARRRGNGLEGVRDRDAAVQLAWASLVVYALQRLAGRPAPEPAGTRRRVARFVVQHRRQLRHQHELAGLRRRDDDELPDADAGADRPELRLGGRRHGHRWRPSSAGFARRSAETIGNFWVDLTRTHALHPAAPLVRARARPRLAGRRPDVRRIREGRASCSRTTYDEPETDKDGKPVLDEKGQPKMKKSTLTEQVLAVGPAASQIAIKQLGTNGGGFFNVNSAHPFENATPLSNFLELLAILVISAALCYTFGVMVGDTRQGWAVLAAMTVDLRGAARWSAWWPSSAATALAELGRRSRRRAPSRRAATWRARRSGSASPTPPCGPRRRPPPPTAR